MQHTLNLLPMVKAEEEEETMEETMEETKQN